MRLWSGLALALTAVALAACTTTTNVGLGGTEGSGVMKTESRPLSAFASVNLSTGGTLEVTQGDQLALTIEAEDNLLPLLTSDVKENRLTLGTIPNTTFRATKAITYRLSVITLEQLTISGSGTAKIATLNAPTFNFELGGSGTLMLGTLTGNTQLVLNIGGSGNARIDALKGQTIAINLKGSGNVTLKGEASDQQLSIEGSGTYDGEGLVSLNAQVYVAGDGDATLNVRDRLEVESLGSGDVLYVGNPTVSRTITGSGGVRQK
jgi:hypothetical protein